ncbi:MAG TPA: protein kinase [Bryobacteraceae bacterium]|nr:protein kinase [Bryobacteraceae bacterium]
MIGQTLGHYQILEKLGAGGMGVVYKARDGRLDRLVALKLLPQGFIDGGERRKRLIQEAKAASALNHPHIVTIYDVDQDKGLDFIAMEYIEGTTLDCLIGKSGARLVEALGYAAQIASALSAAHANRILHRDLKPSNVMVSESGQAKVLDFGLAKVVDPSATGPDVATKTNVAPLTNDGAIMGTAAYMSPEQAEGKKLDARSDIFSLGIILYEMLTGQRPFRGETNVSTMAAILREEPKPVTSLSSALPSELDRIVSRCLRKNPARRFQTMADLQVALEELREEAESGKLNPTAAVPASSPASRWPWIAFAACGFLAAAAAFWYASRPVPPRPEYSFRQLTYDSGLTTTPAISRDGKLVAYASDRASGSNLDLFVQQVAGGKPIRLTNDPADDFQPAFSPDGTQIVFESSRDGGSLYIVSALGGEPRLVAKKGVLPQFSPDGKVIAFQVGGFLRESSIYLMPAGGGPPSKLETDVPHAESPVWSSDGKSILFAGAKEGRITDDWFVVPARGGHANAVGLPARFRNGAPGQWLPDGRAIRRPSSFGSQQRVQILSFGKDHRFLSAESITSGVGWIRGISADPQASRFVTAEVHPSLQIWSVPIEGNTGKVKGPIVPETQGPGGQSYPTVSADGRMLAYNSNKSGIADVYLKDSASGIERALTSSPMGTGRGELSPDGKRVAYARRGSLFLMSTKGGVEERICDACSGGTVLGWTPDSRQIVTHLGRPIELVLIDTQTGKRTPLLRHPMFDLHRGQFSPDGRWLAFNAKSATQSAMRITPFRDGVAAPEKEWISITDGTGEDSAPTWSPDGNLLYFYTGRSGFQDIWARRLNASTKTPVGEPFEVLRFHNARRSLNPSLSKAVTRDRFFWSMEEITGNIWVAEIQGPNP